MRAYSTRPLSALLLAGAFLAFFVGQSPHLVHHLLEGDEAQQACPLAPASERLAGVLPDTVAIVPTQTLERVPESAIPAFSADAPRSAPARAPPFVPSS